MNTTITCEKCGKPFGMFNGKICYECEKKAHEDFKRYCTENNYVPLTTEMYSKAIKAMDVLEQIRNEIRQTVDEEQKHDGKWVIGLQYALKIIDKYKEQTE